MIGTGPSRLWVAGEDQGADFSEDFATNATSKKKGIKGRFKKGGNNDEEDEDGFDYIPDVSTLFVMISPKLSTDAGIVREIGQLSFQDSSSRRSPSYYGRR